MCETCDSGFTVAEFTVTSNGPVIKAHPSLTQAGAAHLLVDLLVDVIATTPASPAERAYAGKLSQMVRDRAACEARR